MIHCIHCGHENGHNNKWPIKCQECGLFIYNSPKPVVAVILQAPQGIVVIKRGIEPHKGTWAFPGGYIDHAEDWRTAASRETQEEIGVQIDPDHFKLVDVITTPTNYLVMFVEGPPIQQEEWACHDLGETLNDNGEQEILAISTVSAKDRLTRSLGIPPHDHFWKNMT